MKVKALKTVLSIVLFVAILTLICLLPFIVNYSKAEAVSASPAENPTVVIDAGHGGEDGGCISSDGTEEKELNLLVAKKLAALLRLADVNVIMTRDDDRLLYDYYDELEDYKGKKKVYDLKNRSLIAESHNNALLVSLHMNSFPDSRYSGLQVWYPKGSSDSLELAQIIQSSYTEILKPENGRKIKSAGSEMYLLDRATHPAVLIECGFLSNADELEKLKTDEYRSQLAGVIFSGIMDFLSSYSSKG